MPPQPPVITSLNNPQNAQLLRSLEASYRAPSAIRAAGMPKIPAGTSFRQAIKRPWFVLRLLEALARIGISLPSANSPNIDDVPVTDIELTPVLGTYVNNLPTGTKVAMKAQVYDGTTNAWVYNTFPLLNGVPNGVLPVKSRQLILVHPQYGWTVSGPDYVQTPNNELWKFNSGFYGNNGGSYYPWNLSVAKYTKALFTNFVASTGEGVHTQLPITITTIIRDYVTVPVPVPIVIPVPPIPEELPVEPEPTPPEPPNRNVPVVNPPIPIEPPRPRSPSWDNPGTIIRPGTITFPKTPSTPSTPFPTTPTPSIPVPIKKVFPDLPTVHPRVPSPDIITPIAPQPVPVPTQPPSNSMPPVPNMPAPPDPPGAIVPSPPGQIVPTQKPGPITDPNLGQDQMQPCASDPCAMAMMGAITLQLANIGKVMASVEALESYMDGEQGQDIAWIKAKLGRRSNLTVEDMADLNTQNLAKANANNIYGIAAAIQTAASLSKSSAIEIANTYNQLATVLNLDFKEVAGNVTQTQLDNNAVAEKNIKQVDVSDESGNLPDESAKNNRLGILASNIYHDSVMNWASTNKALEKILEILSTMNNAYYRTGKIPQNQSTFLPTTYKLKTPVIDGLDGLENDEQQEPVVNEFFKESINELKTKQHTINTLATFNTEYRDDIETQTTKLNEEYEADKEFSDAPIIDEIDHYPPTDTV